MVLMVAVKIFFREVFSSMRSTLVEQQRRVALCIKEISSQRCEKAGGGARVMLTLLIFRSTKPTSRESPTRTPWLLSELRIR